MNKHQLTYIDMHPDAIKPERTPWAAVAAIAAFAAIGLLLAWRG